jgi:hypothetical protein
MSFLGRMTDSWFKANNRGQVAFYPWGILGKGYILGGDEKKNRCADLSRSIYCLL